VGGGRKAGENRPSNPSLAWMISQIILSKAPILFKGRDHIKPPAGFGFASTTSEARTEPRASATVAVCNAAGGTSQEAFMASGPLSPSGSVSPRSGESLTVPGDMPTKSAETALPAHEEIKNLQQLDKDLDAMSPIHDSMAEGWLWRPLECLPFRHSTGYDGSTGWRLSM
ncbi:hypothetical protein FRC01_013374, partial [Tulasnella sp. 417]